MKQILEEDKERCFMCTGEGKIIIKDFLGDTEHKCSYCNGTGKLQGVTNKET